MMAKVYMCDACFNVMQNPFKCWMRVFRVEAYRDDGHYMPTKRKRKRKIHLCDDCFHALRKIAKEKEL